MSRPRLTEILAWAVAATVFAIVGGTLLFTRYMGYDDEGYVLWSVRSYLEGNTLYDTVYSQYGPLFFVGYRALYALTGLVPDSDSARLLTLGYWIGAALLAGASARLLTGTLLGGLSAAGLAFLVLVNNSNEPFHPGSLLALLVASVALPGLRAVLRDREAAFIPLAAALSGAAALIKVNVGGLLFLALGSWIAFHGRGRARLGPFARLALGVALAGVPFLLMARHLADRDFLRFTMVSAGLIAGLAFILRAQNAERFPAKSWLLLILPPAGVAVIVGAPLLAQGTSFAALLEGVLLGPLRHPGVFTFPPNFPASSMPLTVAALALLLWGMSSSRAEPWLAGLRVAGALWFLWECLAPHLGRPPDRFAFYHGPALALLFALPPRGASPAEHRRDRAALWLAWIYAWQLLHAYPVAGSQVAWGCFLWAPLATHGLFRGLEVLRPAFREARARGAAACLLAGSVALSVTRLGLLAVDWWSDSSPLGFAGAQVLRPQTRQAADIRHARDNLIRHADMVFSMPGMFSFNIWTGLPTPTQANVTHWFNLLDGPSQDAIIARLKTADRPALVVMPLHLDYLKRHRIPVGGPLVDFIRENFEPAIDAGHYELWFPRGRRPVASNSFVISPGGLEACTAPLPAPVHAAFLYERESSAPPPPSQTISLTVFALSKTDPAASTNGPLELRPGPGRDWRSRPLGEHQGLVRHLLPIPPLPGRRFSNELLLDLVDREGRVLATCRFDRLRQAFIDAAPPAAD